MRRLQKIGIIILIFIMGIGLIYKPQNVYADNGKKTLVIPIPSNDIGDYWDFYSQFYAELVDEIVYGSYDEQDHMILVNREGQRVLRRIEHNKEEYSFELYEGATIEDCIFDIPDELREEMLEDRGEDPYADYDKVQLVLQEFDPIEVSDSLVLDLSYTDDSFYLSAMDRYLLDMINSSNFETHLQRTSYRRYYNLEGKMLFQSVEQDEKDENYYELGDGVSSDDDIIYELPDDEAEEAGYEKIVIKFGNTEYDDSYYVFDCTNLNEDSFNCDDVWNYFRDKGLVQNFRDVDLLSDLDGNPLMELYECDKTDKIVYLQDFTYVDNLTFDISGDENLMDKYEDVVNENTKTFTIKFANPDFIEGDNQKYDLSSETGARFRLNIPFDKFQESGVVYLDGEVVDPSNYEATEGSTIITFKKAFMNGLDLGDHTLRVSVLDGESTTTFNIVGESPKTGDSIFLYIGLFLMSIVGLAVLSKYKMKKGN